MQGAPLELVNYEIMRYWCKFILVDRHGYTRPKLGDDGTLIAITVQV